MKTAPEDEPSWLKASNMPKLSEESRELLREVSAHPTLFASAPEEADGLIKGLSWMILVKELDLPVADAGQTVWRLVKEVTQSIDAPDPVVILLCRESYPNPVTSFAKFREQCSRFLDLLKAFSSSLGRRQA